jgi:hypothetical protein
VTLPAAIGAVVGIGELVHLDDAQAREIAHGHVMNLFGRWRRRIVNDATCNEAKWEKYGK